jgi:hypothetical protein
MDHKLADAPGSARSIARPEAGGSERLTRVPEAGQPMTRRRFLGAVGLGAGTVVVVGAGGLTWRAVDQGVFATGTGPVYAAWDAWNPPGHNPLDLVRAAVLAANAHNTQPWLFRVTPARIDLLAVPDRNIGTIDPFRREMQISLGCALENLVLAGPPNGIATTVVLMPDPAARTHVARVDLSPVPVSNSPLFEAIPNHHTNRAAFESRPVAQGTLDALTGWSMFPSLRWSGSPAPRTSARSATSSCERPRRSSPTASKPSTTSPGTGEPGARSSPRRMGSPPMPQDSRH